LLSAVLIDPFFSIEKTKGVLRMDSIAGLISVINSLLSQLANKLQPSL